MSGFHNAYTDENNENANPNARAKTHFESFKTIIETHEHTIKKDLMKIFEKSTLNELKDMYAYSNLKHNKHADAYEDAYEDAANMLDTYIDHYEDRLLKNKIKNERLNMQSEFNELIKNATNEELIDAYKSTLNQDGSVKPGHDHASKFLDTLLENRGISRNSKGVVYINNREFGTPYKHLPHRKSSSHHGGSYKKRRRRSLKKSRRVKRRKTNATRKSRK